MWSAAATDASALSRSPATPPDGAGGRGRREAAAGELVAPAEARVGALSAAVGDLHGAEQLPPPGARRSARRAARRPRRARPARRPSCSIALATVSSSPCLRRRSCTSRAQVSASPRRAEVGRSVRTDRHPKRRYAPRRAELARGACLLAARGDARAAAVRLQRAVAAVHRLPGAVGLLGDRADGRVRRLRAGAARRADRHGLALRSPRPAPDAAVRAGARDRRHAAVRGGAERDLAVRRAHPAGRRDGHRDRGDQRRADRPAAAAQAAPGRADRGGGADGRARLGRARQRPARRVRARRRRAWSTGCCSRRSRWRRRWRARSRRRSLRRPHVGALAAPGRRRAGGAARRRSSRRSPA